MILVKWHRQPEEKHTQRLFWVRDGQQEIFKPQQHNNNQIYQQVKKNIQVQNQLNSQKRKFYLISAIYSHYAHKKEIENTYQQWFICCYATLNTAGEKQMRSWIQSTQWNVKLHTTQADKKVKKRV